MIVFVYGTLRKGCSNHHFLHEAPFLGLATTLEKYALYVAGIPYVVPHESISPISGEVYATNPRILTALDALEGHPQYYYREKIRVRLVAGKELSAWIYFYPEKMGVLVKEGDYLNWLQYQRLGQYF